jgi:hypothetical protein
MRKPVALVGFFVFSLWKKKKTTINGLREPLVRWRFAR